MACEVPNMGVIEFDNGHAVHLMCNNTKCPGSWDEIKIYYSWKHAAGEGWTFTRKPWVKDRERTIQNCFVYCPECKD